MTFLRAALVSRRYWPTVGGVETTTAELAQELRRRGNKVQVVTAQWEPSWPQEIFHREIAVHRLPQSTTRLWGTLRYMYALMKWLDHRREKLDAVIVSNLRYDAWCAVRACRGTGVPVILQADGAGPNGDVAWQRSGWWGARIQRTCFEADAVIAPDEVTAGELTAAGYPADRIRRIERGVRVRPERTPAERQAARNALREANPDLSLDDRAPLVVCIGRLLPHRGLVELVRAWRNVAATRPLARLWIIGDGPLRDELWELISDLDLKYRVCLPGIFDDVEDILAAADVFVRPSLDEGLSQTLLEALAAGLPIVATDHAGHEAALAGAAVLVPPGEVLAISGALADLLDDSQLRARLGAAARKRTEERYTLNEQVNRYVRLIEELQATTAAQVAGRSRTKAP